MVEKTPLASCLDPDHGLPENVFLAGPSPTFSTNLTGSLAAEARALEEKILIRIVSKSYHPSPQPRGKTATR